MKRLRLFGPSGLLLHILALCEKFSSAEAALNLLSGFDASVRQDWLRAKEKVQVKSSNLPCYVCMVTGLIHTETLMPKVQVDSRRGSLFHMSLLQ